MKVAILGYSGAGKSTLARALGERYHCPVLHLDQVYHAPGWQTRPLEESKNLVYQFMEQPSWIIDGNYARFYAERRLAEADRILFLNFPRLICLWRVWKRFCRYHGQTREDMAPGCTEKLDLEFVWWILRKGRSREKRAWYRGIQTAYPEKTIVLKSQREITRYLEGCSDSLCGMFTSSGAETAACTPESRRI